ncbi:hypothetical protein OG455_41870 [Kitasatospora sp. NBC_01287]|uniref:recombination directionality factor n=1 Tax=Kitasatospora sp. NBC_01287 TaxID=2903573 RepID=UPI00225A7626|nr:hypothetical protein [Kitasatospora sp. NBC_01287]MCX4751715.1 hypothetical protein [Kitasatospora sp. NBC_01287]MCX4751993.1 hypothetical protein [Kitasatospora sp. NBC_01287]
MPILDLQRRMRQLGEIRIGHVVDTGKVSKTTGKKILRPAKLDKFRFTSPSRQILEQVAALYGGTVQPWTPANGGPSEFEVYSTADRLPVVIPPQNAVSQWYELFKGSKCVRRCDGATEHKSDKPCLCDPVNRECAITTRVNVMLRDLPALGQWLLVSKGYYAAVELPPAAELLAQVGGYVPGWLGMEEKLVQRDERPARFMVPTLDVEITPTELMSGQLRGGAGQVAAAPGRAAIEAPTVQAGPPKDFHALAMAAKTVEEVRLLYKEASAAGAPVAYLATLEQIGAGKVRNDGGLTERLSNPGDYGGTSAEDEAAQVSALFHDSQDDVIEPEIVNDEDPTEVWFQIVAAAGARGWSTSQTEERFAEFSGGTMPGSAETTQLREFLTSLKAGTR